VPAFLAGLAKEPLISETGEIRLKPREVSRALRTLVKLADSDRNAVIDEILASIQRGVVRDPWMFRHQRTEFVTSVRRVAEHEGLERLAEVAAALEGAAVDDDDDSEE
jgi:hypothetical protein